MDPEERKRFLKEFGRKGKAIALKNPNMLWFYLFMIVIILVEIALLISEAPKGI